MGRAEEIGVDFVLSEEENRRKFRTTRESEKKSPHWGKVLPFSSPYLERLSHCRLPSSARKEEEVRALLFTTWSSLGLGLTSKSREKLKFTDVHSTNNRPSCRQNLSNQRLLIHFLLHPLRGFICGLVQVKKV